MTDETQPDDDSYIVRVKAVVMTRDDSSGGWLPQEGGCLCRVGVCKVLSADLLGRSSFLICGERLKDKEVILECFLKKDLIYTKATPTFHHWKVDNQKWGLTFLSSADARAFDRGVRRAIEDLTEGSTTSSSTIQNEAELGDDDVFTNATDSSSNSSQKKELPMETLAPLCLREARQHHCILGHIYDQRRPLDHYLLNQSMPVFPLHVSCRVEDEEIVRINPRERAWLTGYEDYRYPTTTREKHIRPENAYVHFAKSLTPKQDYIYPYPIDFDAQLDRDSKSNRVDGIGSHRAVVTAQPRALQPKGRRRKEEGERSRCVYCQDMFNHEENGRGRCHEAPDPVQTCIHRVSFMWCADSLLYHCMSDPEGDYSDPCSCDTSDERLCLRWLALVMLSMLAPCMCCYGPLRVCYRCGVACHCCGGKHKPVG